MMSHALPEPVLAILENLVSGLEERLQADAHRVARALAEHPAFDARWVESPLIRALIASTARELQDTGVLVEELANGGVEITHVHEGVERRFRLRRAKRDRNGLLEVTTSSDSLLTMTARDPTLFDDEAHESAPSPALERWVLAYLLHPGTRTFFEVSAARVVGLIGNHAPYRLKLADVVHIPHTAPLPPGFKPDKDDLDLPDEDEDRGEEAG